MKKSIIIILAALSVTFIFSCQDRMSDADRNAGQQGSMNQEIKRISEAEIMTAGLNRGQKIADIAQQTLGAVLSKTIESDGNIGALDYCNINAYPLIDSLSKANTATIRRVSLRLRNPADSPDSIERELLESYEYSIEQGVTVSGNIQDAGEEYLLYTRPILINQEMCLQCHGKIGKELSLDTNEAIKELYPSDRATGHTMNDLRGMWSIRLLKKDIVNSL